MYPNYLYSGAYFKKLYCNIAMLNFFVYENILKHFSILIEFHWEKIQKNYQHFEFVCHNILEFPFILIGGRQGNFLQLSYSFWLVLKYFPSIFPLFIIMTLFNPIIIIIERTHGLYSFIELFLNPNIKLLHTDYNNFYLYRY